MGEWASVRHSRSFLLLIATMVVGVMLNGVAQGLGTGVGEGHSFKPTGTDAETDLRREGEFVARCWSECPVHCEV